MNAIVSGRSGRALILDGESLKSFDLDDPSTIVPRHRSDLPYLFGEAADLRTIENTTIESVKRELRMDCHFTWALDLALIALDAELEDDIRTDALEDLQQLLAESATAMRLEKVLYAKPLPEDADLRGALGLSDHKALSTVFGFLRRLEEHQPSITGVSHAFEIIPTKTFGGQENREVFEHVLVREGVFLGLATLDYPGALMCILLETELNPSIQHLPNYRQVLQNFSRQIFKDLNLDELHRDNEDWFMQLLDPKRDPQLNTEINEQNERYLRRLKTGSADLTEREKHLFLSHLRGYTNEEIASAWREDIKVIRKEMNAVIAKIRYRLQRKKRKPESQRKIGHFEKLANSDRGSHD